MSGTLRPCAHLAPSFTPEQLDKAERLWKQGMRHLPHLADASGVPREDLMAYSILWNEGHGPRAPRPFKARRR